jgi:DNA-binding NtrC family response regulator
LKRIFLLDDDHDIVDVVKRILQSKYTVHAKTDTEGITEEITSFGPDLLMLDNFIGEKRAADIIQTLKASNPSFGIPVILFSASHDVEHLAKNIGATAYLEKPASISKIREFVQQVLQP